MSIKKIQRRGNRSVAYVFKITIFLQLEQVAIIWIEFFCEFFPFEKSKNLTKPVSENCLQPGRDMCRCCSRLMEMMIKSFILQSHLTGLYILAAGCLQKLKRTQ